MQAAKRGNDFLARPQREVIGVSQYHLRPRLADVRDGQSLDGSLRTNRHERGQLHNTMRGREAGTSGRATAIDVPQLE